MSVNRTIGPLVFMFHLHLLPQKHCLAKLGGGGGGKSLVTWHGQYYKNT